VWHLNILLKERHFVKVSLAAQLNTKGKQGAEQKNTSEFIIAT